MASPRASPAALVRPVTARTWQALSGSPAAAPDDSRRMSVYNNDLYNNSGGAGAAAANPRPASPLYQPASARPGTPTPRSAERLQQQRIATPSRLQAEGTASPCQRLAAAANTGLSTANVPAGAAQEQREQGASPKRPATDARPVTAPAQPPAGTASPLRVTTFSLAALAAPKAATVESPRPSTAGGPIPGSSIAVDSPRVRQQLLGHFAGAVPAGAAGHSRSGSGGGATSPLGASPRPTLHGERGRGSGGGGPTARPSTPSFRPVAEAAARPATSMAAVQPQASGPDHFSIRAVHQGAPGAGGSALPTSLGAYPQPPMTAPPKAAAAPAASDSQPPPAEPGSLASFGIAAGAFVAAAPKAGGRAGQGEAAALPAPRALTREAMLASASFATKADLRWEDLWVASSCREGLYSNAVGCGASQRGRHSACSAPRRMPATVCHLIFHPCLRLPHLHHSLPLSHLCRRFLLAPGPADAPLQCKVLRSRGGLLRGAPLYTLLVEQEGGRGGTFLLAARTRKGGPGGATYVLSVRLLCCLVVVVAFMVFAVWYSTL